MSAERRDGGLVRLNKFLADRGVASRRRSDELIASGAVTVDGLVVTALGTRIDPGAALVEVDGVPLGPPRRGRKRYYLLNKPPGVVCTNDVRETRPRAVDLITDREKGRIYTVGRLDEESKGLILLTDDGEFANRVMHPRYGVPKTYMVKLRGRIDDEKLQKVRAGVHVAGGRTGGARVVARKRSREYSHLLVTLHEGMNREIRRMFARVGFDVVDLRRARIGNLTDRGLKLGSWRPLKPAEVADLLAPGAREEYGGEKPRGACGRGRGRGRGRGTPARVRREETGKTPRRAPKKGANDLRSGFSSAAAKGGRGAAAGRRKGGAKDGGGPVRGRRPAARSSARGASSERGRRGTRGGARGGTVGGSGRKRAR